MLKLTAVLEARSPIFLSAHVSHGPSQDSPSFKPTAAAACRRCPVESGCSRQKRLLGPALRARRWASQKKEILLRVLTHNRLLLAAASDFDRASMPHTDSGKFSHTDLVE